MPPMIAMKARTAQAYAGRRIKPGETFSVDGRGHARLLSAIGRADLIATEVPAVEAPTRVPVTQPAPVVPEGEPLIPISEPPAEPQTENVSCETDAQPDSPASEEEPALRIKRKYQRRDLTAES